ncbi:MAG: hypothetical protein JNK45_15660 [Myxococcales bacterium]|nr:hypothetical protein [Myxococcales bacterium]
MLRPTCSRSTWTRSIATRSIGALALALVAAGGCSYKKAAPSGGFGEATRPSGSEQLATRGDFGSPANTAPRDAEVTANAPSPSPSLDDGDALRRPEPRGLGTSFGEQRFSAVVDAPFVRASNIPDVELAVFYNDLDGVRSTAGSIAIDSRGGLESRVTSPDGLVALALVDDAGRSFPAAQLDGRRYAIGRDGEAYRLGVENHSSARLEVVASVDGLDVIDGDDAGFHKRGYIVDAFSSVVIDGWRTSGQSVAAFRFSSIDDSYADRTGRPRTIGVVGAAFFRERGAFDTGDLRRRHDADPFPGRFAPPPPPRRWR